MVMTQPFIDLELGGDDFHRYIPEDVDELDLVWHRDTHDRAVRVIQGDGWKFQFDNKMPFDLQPQKTFLIPAMVYHRVIKGNGPLELVIEHITFTKAF